VSGRFRTVSEIDQVLQLVLLCRQERLSDLVSALGTIAENCRLACPKNPVDGLVLFVKFPARLTDLEQQA
jgi:hypothetical protein